VYLQNSEVAPLDEAPIDQATVGVMPYAADPESAQRLWELSERLLKALQSAPAGMLGIVSLDNIARP
jgi:hypothetical protein